MKICHYCGSEFVPSKFDDGRKRFCSTLHQYKSWVEKNKERAKEIARKSKVKHQESRQNYNRAYYAKNKVAMQVKLLSWRRKNKAKAVQQVLLRRYRKRGAGGGHTLEQWEELKLRYKNRCAICKEIKPLTRDHIIPVTKNGTSNIENIQPLCQPCNSRKFNHLQDDKEKVRHSE